MKHVRMYRVLLGIGIGSLILCLAGGFLYKRESAKIPSDSVLKNDQKVDPSIFSHITHKKGQNFAVLHIFGMKNNYQKITYELHFDSQGKRHKIVRFDTPIDVRGKDAIDVAIDLRTCEGDICIDHPDASKLWIFLEYTDNYGNINQTGTP